MKNNKGLEGKLLQIKALAEECLTEMGSSTRKKEEHAALGPHSARSLADHILALRGGGFFKQPKTSSEVYEKVKITYPCEQNRVAVELIRLHDKKELRKISNKVGKIKQVSYVA
jgi:hypothetical protein